MASILGPDPFNQRLPIEATKLFEKGIVNTAAEFISFVLFLI